MLSKQSTLLLTLSLLTLSACSATKQPKMEEFFHTKIHDDGSKRFTFSLIVIQGQSDKKDKSQKRANKPSKGSGNRGGNKNGDRENKQGSSNKESSRTSKMTELFEERFQEQMIKNQYCREGYITLDSGFSGAIYTLRGECQENATEEDRKHFL